MEVRPARAEDVPLVTAWTRETFDWGDYVPDRLPGWLDDPASHTLVCVDEGLVVGVVNTVMLSETEAWLEGARVHPVHRRRGIGSTMNRAGLDWARDRGARVVRLATEENNTAARRQVEDMGYRRTSSWVFAWLTPLQNPPTSLATKMRPAPSADVDAAWMSWISGDVSRAGRELLSIGWRWRTATPDDLRTAVRNQNFLESPAGWVIVEPVSEGRWSCGWLATTPDAAPDLFDDLTRSAREEAVEEVGLRVPATPWLVEALVRSGAEPEPVSIYSITP